VIDTWKGADGVLMIGVQIGPKLHWPPQASTTSGGGCEQTRIKLTTQLRRLAPMVIQRKAVPPILRCLIKHRNKLDWIS
jgi:hypothetical protein